jgi:hypothetical protein
MSDLLQIFLKMTLNGNNDKPHRELDVNELETHALFALQLLHRWCIRLALNTKYPAKPVKSMAINV